MKGFVTTPPAIVDLMVAKLFANRPPRADSRILDPGCGTGAFVDGIIRWCGANKVAVPRIVGIELDPAHASVAVKKFRNQESIEIRETDFLTERNEVFEFVVGNPPYVSLGGLDTEERERYRARYMCATNRFDLYALFFEESVRRLAVGGRMVFITPEKYSYVESAASLRRLLAQRHVSELHYLDESTFGDLVTYPLVTTVVNGRRDRTAVVLRDGTRLQVMLSASGDSWQSTVQAQAPTRAGKVLADACARISCGIATGADQEFLVASSEMVEALAPFAYPTISGRQLVRGKPVQPGHYLLVPYQRDGSLMPEHTLGALGRYLSEPARQKKLLERTCTRSKPWYAFHETPQLEQILQPKILCKDIGSEPHFFIDLPGAILPRHSVYYIVPKDRARIGALCDYLNSEASRRWLVHNCQRAAKGFVRLQSHVLKKLPIPSQFVKSLSVDDAGEVQPATA